MGAGLTFSSVELEKPYSALTFLEIADLRFAALFL